MKLGETEYEKNTKSIQESREIVKEIIKFGITEEQKIDVMFFLAIELEDRSILEEVVSVLKKYRSKIKPSTEAEYDKEELKSKDNKKLLGI